MKKIDDVVKEIRGKRQSRRDNAENGWFTTEEGHRVHFNKEGFADKGNPHVLAKLNGGKDSRIKTFSTGAGKDEVYMRSEFMDGDKVAGYVSFSEYQGVPHIQFIETKPGYRRQGIAAKLLKDLQKQYPGKEIDFGMTTPEGTKLLEAVTYEVKNKEVIEKKERLNRLTKDLEKYQKKLDHLFNIENPTSKQMTEMERIGDKWQSAYEESHRLEEELIGQKKSARFVK